MSLFLFVASVAVVIVAICRIRPLTYISHPWLALAHVAAGISGVFFLTQAAQGDAGPGAICLLLLAGAWQACPWSWRSGRGVVILREEVPLPQPAPMFKDEVQGGGGSGRRFVGRSMPVMTTAMPTIVEGWSDR
jgi:hypothetical protein